MALIGSEPAYLFARSGIARSGASRSNYVDPGLTMGYARRDASGAVISVGVVTDMVLLGSLHITQALNDEPDTCSFEVGPQPFFDPRVGDEIRITHGTETLFDGYILTSQADWRLGNLHRPWVAVQCQDVMFRFDARIVTYRFPAQSVTQSIADLVRYFCNLDAVTPHPLDFVTTAVAAGMPSLPSFDVVNQRPSTVMRTLTAAVGGGFYVDGVTVHAWAGSVTEPGMVNPTPLTVNLPTLKSFRLTTDATQLRRRVLVEGRRTSTLITYPDIADWHISDGGGLPLEDASIFDLTVSAEALQVARLGAQWVRARRPIVMSALENPPQTRTAAAFTPGNTSILLRPMAVLPPQYGWIRVGNQYSRYGNYTGNPLTENWTIFVTPAIYPYGKFTVAFPIDTTVEWIDSVNSFVPNGFDWDIDPQNEFPVHGQPVSTPVVTLAVAEAPFESWPQLESLVQDGRYSYAGAQARAEADLDAFKAPLQTAEWVTDDPAARPGREQVIALDSAAVSPPVNLTVTILTVDLTFPLRTLPPRRACTGGVIKPSTFMDLVVTTSD